MKAIIPLLTLSILTITSCNKQWTDPSLNKTDENFVIMAAFHNLNEIEAGALTHTKSLDKAVVEFADKMEYEHREAQNELRTLLESNHLTMRFDENLETMKLRMIQLKGRTFDSTYVHTHVYYQQNIMKIFQDEIDNGNDQGLKYYASKYINHIKLYNNQASKLAREF